MVNGWGFSGVTVLHSGQPYSVIDFSGGAASIYRGDGYLSERFQLKYDLKLFNIFNHPSFDIPSNNVQFNPGFCYPPSPNFDCSSAPGYSFPPQGHLGVLEHTIGSPRFIQMALHLTF